MGKIYKYTAALILCMGIGTLSAQIRTAYFMDKSTVRTSLNPALLPGRGYVSIPVLGALDVSFSTNGIAAEDLFYPKNGKLVTFMDASVATGDFLGRLKRNNQINLDFRSDIFAAGWYSRRAFWNFNISVRGTTNLNVPKTMFEFIKNGTGAEGSVYNISDLSYHLDSYVEAAVGYARPINERLTVGGKLKFLFGAGNLDMQFDEFTARLDENSWRITSRGQLYASMKGLELEYDTDNHGQEYIDNFDMGTPGLAGFGVGIDLGAEYRILDNLVVSGSVLDLGFISWQKGATSSGYSDGTFEFDGFDLPIGNDSDIPSMSDQIDNLTDDLENLVHFTEGERKARTTMLRATLNLGVEYSIANDIVGFGLLSSTRFYRPKAYTELTASVNCRPCYWFSTSLSYSFLHSGFKTFGFAMNFSPSFINFFVGTDYMLGKVSKEFIPVSTHATNLYFGLSVPIGRYRSLDCCSGRYARKHGAKYR